MIPILHRGQALETFLKPGVVVPEDVIIYGPVKLINTDVRERPGASRNPAVNWYERKCVAS